MADEGKAIGGNRIEFCARGGEGFNTFVLLPNEEKSEESVFF